MTEELLTLKQALDRRLKSYIKRAKEDIAFRNRLLKSTHFTEAIELWKTYRSNKPVYVFKWVHEAWGDMLYRTASQLAFDIEEELSNLQQDGEKTHITIELVKIKGKELGSLYKMN